MNFESSSYNQILISIYPVLIVSRFFGIMSLSPKQNMKLSISKLRLICSGICCSMYMIHAILTPLYVVYINTSKHANRLTVRDTLHYVNDIFYSNIKQDAVQQNKMQILAMKAINPILLSLMGLCAHWTAFVKLPTEFPNIIETLSKADEFLRTRFWIEYSMINKKQLNYCFNSAVTFVMFGVMINAYYLFTLWKSWGISLTFFWCILLALGNVTALVMELQFISLVNLLTIRFKALNRHISENIEGKSLSGFTERFTRRMEHAKGSLPLPFTITNKFLLSDLGIARPNLSLASLIESSRQFHRDLCKLITSINRLYQLQMLCSLVACFVRAVLNIYFGIFGYASTMGSTTNANRLSEFLLIISWSAFFTLRFVNLVFSAEYMTREVRMKN